MDLAAAQEYVYALTGDPNTPLTFQIFDDTPAHDQSKARVITGTVADSWSEITGMNLCGCGIFVYVNVTEGGNLEQHVTQLRAAYVDCDTGPLPSLAVKPSFVVRTARGEHAYWLLQPGEPIDKLKPFLKALSKSLGTDTQVVNANRVLRLPGTMHCKGSPTPTTIAVNDTQTRYTIRELAKAFGLTEGSKKPAPRSLERASAIERCAAYMAKVPPAVEGNGGDAATYKACCVGADFGIRDDEFWPILCAWNRTCVPPWSDKDLRRKLANAGKYRQEPIGQKAEREPPAQWDEEPPLIGEEYAPPEVRAAITETERLEVKAPRCLTMGEVFAVWQDRAEVSYVPTPIPQLNRATGGGLPVQGVTTVTAYTGCYKSEFVRQLIKHAAQAGYGAVHVDVELGYAQIYDRYLSEESGIPHSKVRDRNRRTAGETDLLLAAAQVVNDTPIRMLCPDSPISFAELEEIVCRVLPDTSAVPTLVAFDSIQRMANGHPADTPRMRVEAFNQWMEGFAKRRNVAVLAVTEQSRAQGGGKPRPGAALTAGAESRSNEYNPSVLISLDWVESEDDEPMAGHSDEPGERQVDLRIFKNRYGPLGRVSNSVVFLRPCWGMRVEQNPITGFARELMEAMEFDTAYSIREIQRALGKSKHQTIKKHLIYLEGRDIVYETTGKWVRPSAGTQRGATRPGTQKGGGQVAPEQDEFNYAN